MECEESVSEDDFIEEVLFSPHDDSQCTLYYTSSQCNYVVLSLFENLSRIQTEDEQSNAYEGEEDFFDAGGELAFECNVEKLLCGGELPAHSTLSSP